MNVVAGLEILSVEICRLLSATWLLLLVLLVLVPPQTAPLAFTFLREEKEEAGPHLIHNLSSSVRTISQI